VLFKPKEDSKTARKNSKRKTGPSLSALLDQARNEQLENADMKKHMASIKEDADLRKEQILQIKAIRRQTGQRVYNLAHD
jgi:hypothetical protein